MVNEKETTMNMNMRKQQGKVYDVMEHPRKPMNKKVHVSAPLPTRLPKPVDEDLYKIPPELLRTTKRVGWSLFYLIILSYVLNCVNY